MQLYAARDIPCNPGACAQQVDKGRCKDVHAFHIFGHYLGPIHCNKRLPIPERQRLKDSFSQFLPNALDVTCKFNASYLILNSGCLAHSFAQLKVRPQAFVDEMIAHTTGSLKLPS